MSRIGKSFSGAAMALLSLAIVLPLFFDQWEFSLFILSMVGLCVYIANERKQH